MGMFDLLKKKKSTENSTVRMADAFFDACESGQVDVVANFLKRDREYANTKDVDGITVLMNAAGLGHLSVVKLLIDNGANVNSQIFQGKHKGTSALVMAAAGGHPDIVRLLISSGANVNVIDSDGKTALIRVTLKGYTDIVKILVNSGADLNLLAGEEKMTALMLACDRGYEDIVQVLLSSGADPNIQDVYGYTALMFKESLTNVNITTLLIKSGIDVTLQSHEGDIALPLAISEGNQDVINILGRATKVALTNKFNEMMNTGIIPIPYPMTQKRRDQMESILFSGIENIVSLCFDSLSDLFDTIPVFKDMFAKDFGLYLKEDCDHYDLNAKYCGRCLIINGKEGNSYQEIPYQISELIPICVRIIHESAFDDTEFISFY